MFQSSTVSRRVIWAARLQRFRVSQLTVKVFCQQEGVSQPSFYQWKKKLGGQLEKPQPKFLPVHATVIVTPQLVLPGGAAIRIPTGITRDQLTELITATILATDLASIQTGENHNDVNEGRS